MFLLTDISKKGIISIQQCITCFKNISLAARLVVGSNLQSWLSKVNTEIRVLINIKENCISDILLGKTEYEANHRRITFTLPIIIEEVLAQYACSNVDESMELIQSKLCTLDGMIFVFSQNISKAEDNFIHALKILESLGFDMEVISCKCTTCLLFTLLLVILYNKITTIILLYI
jgi:hypothetical protein